MNPHVPDDEAGGPDGDAGPDMITMNSPRWQRWRPGRPVSVAAVAVVALAGGGGVGYAATHSLTAKAADTTAIASAPSASPSPSGNSTPGSGPKAGHGWRAFGGRLHFGGFGPGLGGLVHGQVTVPKSGGGYQTLDVQNGTVTSVSSNSVTVKSADGFTASYTVTSSTVVEAKSAGIGSVKTGDTVFVIATVSGSTATAANIADVTAIKAGHASFGFPAPAKPSVPASPS